DEVLDHLVDPLLPMLGAAGHGAILLDDLERHPRRAPGIVLAGRAAVRDVAAHPDWRIRWIERRSATPSPGPDLGAVVAAPPDAGDPGNDFIEPTMRLVDE